jgi:Uma2 family endonuclease
METETRKRLFTVDELHQMDKAGLFRNQHVELIGGEIFLMANGNRHQARVDRVTDLFGHFFRGRANLRGQGPLLVDQYNLPEPDVMLIKRRSDFYESAHPGPADVFLLLEISDSSITHDRDVKLALYAIAGIPEYWIEDIREDVVLVFRDPIGDTYSTQLTFRRGESISCRAFPDVQFKVEDILG